MELAPDLLLYTTLSSAISCCRPGFYIDHCDVMSSFDILSAEFDTLMAENIIFTGGYVRYGIFSHGKWWHALNCRAFPISSQIGRWKQAAPDLCCNLNFCSMCSRAQVYTTATWSASSRFFPQSLTLLWLSFVCWGYVRYDICAVEYGDML